MTTQRSTHTDKSNHNLAARVGRWSVQHRRKAILGWLAFVFVALVLGFNVMPQKQADPNAGMPGEVGKAAQAMDGAFPDKAGESVLIQSKTLKAADSQFKSAVADVSQRLHRVEGVIEIEPGQVSKDGHSVLVDFALKGDKAATDKTVVNSLAAVEGAAKAHPQLRIDEAGDTSLDKAQKDQDAKEAGKSLILTLGLTLFILMFTFGAVVAAGIPVLLGLTSVLATVGLLGPVSQIAPVSYTHLTLPTILRV